MADLCGKSYEEWTLEQLKRELRRRQAKLAGRKKELVARLRFLDVNQPPAGPSREEPELEYAMTLPMPETYKDLHPGMKEEFPCVITCRLEDYLGQFYTNLVEKIKSFYKERFVRYIRVSNIKEEVIFITSCVWAEMRKAASYRVDISLNRASVVQEAQCECGAGQGPSAHCKHVRAVLYGLVSFSQTGDIITELTCTQVLQTFHKVKNFRGSPMKVEQLQDVRGKGSKKLIFDPRPEHLRKRPGATDKFRNHWINFGLAARHPMPVLQLFPPANLPAVCSDHDYLKLTPEDQYLEDSKVTKITSDEATRIEEMTRGQVSSQVWADVRTHHVTSSNFGTICKATDRRDLKKLAASMVSPVDLKTPAIIHGRKYESVAVEAMEQQLGIHTSECGIFVCPDHPQLAASPDRTIDLDTCVEVKCPFTSKDKKISPRTVPYLRNIDGKLTLDRNHTYYYQIQGQLLCSGRKKCYFVVYTLVDLHLEVIFKDDEFIKTMVEKLLAFYRSYLRPAILQKFVYKYYNCYSFQ